MKRRVAAVLPGVCTVAFTLCQFRRYALFAREIDHVVSTGIDAGCADCLSYHAHECIPFCCIPTLA
jgi:hypothetical protein